MLHRHDLGMAYRVAGGNDDRCGLEAERNAVFNVESDVGHVILTFYVDVWRGRPYPPHPRRDGVLYYLLSTQKAKCTTKNAFFQKSCSFGQQYEKKRLVYVKR